VYFFICRRILTTFSGSRVVEAMHLDTPPVKKGIQREESDFAKALPFCSFSEDSDEA
jgi:hypothetical protein